MSNFNCDSFEQIEKNLDRLFVPKYYPGFILSIYENGNESFFLISNLFLFKISKTLVLFIEGNTLKYILDSERS